MNESSKRKRIDYDNLPDDPHQAFVYLEGEFRDRMEAVMDDHMNAHEYNHYITEYANQVIAAAQALEIDDLNIWMAKLPIEDQRDQRQFRYSVDSLVTRLAVSRAVRVKTYSVPLDDATKAKLRRLVGQIRTTLDKLDIEERKRESLHAKLTVFASEIDMNRTRFDAYAAFVLDVASTSNEAVEKIEPLRKLVDSISNVFGKAAEVLQSFQRLAAPAKPKQITGPSPAPTPSRPSGSGPSWEADKGGDLDDEIPF